MQNRSKCPIFHTYTSAISITERRRFSWTSLLIDVINGEETMFGRPHPLFTSSGCCPSRNRLCHLNISSAYGRHCFSAMLQYMPKRNPNIHKEPDDSTLFKFRWRRYFWLSCRKDIRNVHELGICYTFFCL